MCIIKKNLKISLKWENSVTKDYNNLLIVMKSAFDYSLTGLLFLQKLKHLLSGKQNITRKILK